MDAIETFTDEETGIVARVEYDPFERESPREHDGNVWTLIGFHNNHRTFGDEEISIEEEREYERIEETDNGLDLAKYFRDNHDAHLIVPVQCYDHSLVSYYAGNPVTEHWDTGTAGVAILTKADLDKEFDGDEDKAREGLDGELETFTEWANGEIYAFVVEDSDGETLDSCAGFYGLEHCEGEAKDALKHAVEQACKEQDAVRYWAERDVETVA